MRINTLVVRSLLAACLLAWPATWALAQSAAAQAQGAGPTAVGYTVPSKHLKDIRFALPGVISKIPVQPGSAVKAGDLLMAQDDRQERLELERLKIDAESDLPVKAAMKESDLRKTERERKEDLFKRQVLSEQEYLQAKFEEELALLKIDKAKQEQKQAKLNYERQLVKVEQMKVASPVDGIVEQVNIQEGETSDPNKPVMTIVKNDPLWVEVSLPTGQSQALMKLEREMRTAGKKLMVNVRYAGEESQAPVQAEVWYFGPLAYAGADKQLVRLSMPNPAGRSSGLRVAVELPRELSPVAAKDKVAGN